MAKDEAQKGRAKEEDEGEGGGKKSREGKKDSGQVFLFPASLMARALLQVA